MKNKLPYLFALFVITASLCRAQTTLSSKSATGWTISHPFQHHVFIENKGQFANDQKKINEPILYYNRLGKTAIYFCTSSITFCYDSIIQTDEDNNAGENKLNDHDLKKNVKETPQFLTMAWLNANPHVQVDVQQPESTYFAYPNPVAKAGSLSIRAHAWKKLIYRNIYTNIDVEFYYPDKGGIEYNVIVHPGARLTDVQMAYSAGAKITLKGKDALISYGGINLTDHAPVAQDEKGNPVLTSFIVSNNTLSFRTGDYDKTQMLTIDPWITATNFFVYNVAYDVNYDNSGNVYIAGGQSPYQLQQFDSNGNQVWSYTSSQFTGGLGYYGSFTTDVRSGSSYFVRGLGIANTYLNVLKLDNQGNLVAQDSDPNPGYVEYWRVAFDYAHNQLVIAAGEDYQAALIDTNLKTVNDLSLLNPGYTHDMCMLALDGQGNAYMASNNTFFEDTTYFNNELFKYPLPSLTAPLFTVKDHYHFTELISLTFYPEQPNGVAAYANGFNGLAADKNMVVCYNGASLKKYSSTNGALKDSIKISNQDFLWSGLDLDCTGNIYVGDNNKVIVLDSGFNRLDTLPLSNTVFALKIGNNRLYACGYDFVQSMDIPGNASAVITAKASPASYCLGGSTTLTASGGANYTWSPSTGLSATTGTTVVANPTVTTTYTVSGVNTSGCPGATVSTVVVTVTAGLTVTPPLTSPICNGDSAILNISGATNYIWSPSTGLNSTTGSSVIANPTVTTTYTIVATNNVCTDTVQTVVTVTPTPLITIQPPSLVLCSGQSDTLTANGGTIYAWSPSTGLSASTGSSVVANPTATITYTVTGIGSGGCTGTNSVTVTVVASPNKPTFHQHGDTLISSSHYDNQWYRNDSVLTNDTSQYLVITSIGEYKVIVNNEANGCSTPSDSMAISTVTGINQLTVSNNQLSIYPNPFSNQLTVISKQLPIDEIDVVNELGQLIFVSSSGLGNKNTIDLSRLPNGMYFMTVITKTSRVVLPVVKQ